MLPQYVFSWRHWDAIPGGPIALWSATLTTTLSPRTPSNVLFAMADLCDSRLEPSFQAMAFLSSSFTVSWIPGAVSWITSFQSIDRSLFNSDTYVHTKSRITLYTHTHTQISKNKTEVETRANIHKSRTWPKHIGCWLSYHAVNVDQILSLNGRQKIPCDSSFSHCALVSFLLLSKRP